MKPVSYKRIFAYLIDVIIIAFVGVLIGYIVPVSDKYEESSDELMEVISDYTDKKIEEDEYINKVNDISYTLNKESVPLSIISVVLYTIYFVVIPYYNNGQTFGKKIMKLKIVSNKGKKLSMNNYLIRALIVDSILSSIIGVITILVLSKASYIETYNIVSYAFTCLYIITFAMILFSKDGRGLHDYLARTKVVVVDDLGNPVQEEKVKEESKDEEVEDADIVETKEVEEKEETKKEVKEEREEKKVTKKETPKKVQNKNTKKKSETTKKSSTKKTTKKN